MNVLDRLDGLINISEGDRVSMDEIIDIAEDARNTIIDQGREIDFLREDYRRVRQWLGVNDAPR
jgi:hypothetical protein